MKILILCTLAIAALAEPPVNNRYLPPQQGFGNSFGTPSNTYGPPGAGSGFGSQRQTDAVFRGRPSSSYGAPSFNSRPNRPSSQYGAPNSFGAQTPSSQYLPANQGLQTPSSQYGAPGSQGGFGGPSSQYSAPGSQVLNAPSSQYGAPNAQSGFGAPSTQYGAPGAQSGFGAPSTQYGAPGAQGGLSAPSSQYGAPNGFSRQPSQQYGAPGFGGVGGGQQYSQGGFGGNSFGDQNRAYLPPNGGGRGGYAGGDDGSNGEPANYSFEYMVKDEQSGNDFGHRESRQGDRAEGLYYVLLPDGRKQTVEYEADQDGYKPRISYEDTGLGQGGYDRNSQGRGLQGGFNQGGPY
ncbi:hypothetical protein ABMA27_010107 [Loxostege sticticalis]|uniref:Pro-resilin n=1 Tax=Loxostege sticticalis TaxID=481309 RepID=A0ABR3H4L7_LOXSC